MRFGQRARALVAMLGVATLLGGCTAVENLTGRGDAGPRSSDIPTALIVDGSGSMNTDDAPGPRIDAARTAARTFIDALPDGTDFSLWTYGLNTTDREEDHDEGCRDTSNLIPMGDIDHAAARDAIDGIEPRGWSPIAATMRQAGESLPTDVEASLVVVTDGEDHCGRPTICEVARELHESHPLLRIDAVGFKIDDDELNCAATTTGGLYVTADNTEQLTARLAASRDPELSMSTMTGRSLQGIEVGASHSDIKEGYADFPDLADGEETECTTGDCVSDVVTVIHWRDCDWHFGEDGILRLVDPGASARTIDGVSVGDSADDLGRFYGEPIDEMAGTLDGDDVSVRWYRADEDLGLAWRIVVDPDDTIRTIVLCRCLPGTGGTAAADDGSERDRGGGGAATAGAGSGAGGAVRGGGGDATEILVFDVFADDGSVREPFRSRIVEGDGPPSVACAEEPEPGTNLRSCGQYATDWSVGECSVAGNEAFCPLVDESGDFVIERYPFDRYYEAGSPGTGDVWPTAVLDSEGTVHMRHVRPGTGYVYVAAESLRRSGPTSAGLVADSVTYPFDDSSPTWTATRGQGDMPRGGRTVDIVRVYYFE